MNLINIAASQITFHGTSKKELKEIRYFFDNEVVLLPNYFSIKNVIKSKIRNQILYIGRIHPIKKIENLIKAVSLSKEFKNLNYHLIIAGINEERYQDYYDSLVSLVETLNLGNRVFFLGHVIGNKKSVLFAESKVTVLPSDTENFGNVVLESLSMGVPVIASQGTPWSILNEIKGGSWVNNSPESLCSEINRFIIMSEVDYRKVKKSARNLAVERFEISNGVNNWIRTYQIKINRSK